jgi:hypothetical protein
MSFLMKSSAILPFRFFGKGRQRLWHEDADEIWRKRKATAAYKIPNDANRLMQLNWKKSLL